VTASVPQFLGMLIACGAAAGALLARDARLRYGCALVALIAAPVLIAGDVWGSSRLVALRHPPEKLAVAVAAAVVVAAAVAAIFRRWPWSFPSRPSRSCPCGCRFTSAGRPRTSSCRSMW